MAIDVGSPAIDRSQYASANTTFIDTTNPANADGTIDTVKIGAVTNLSNTEVALFYVVTGQNFTSRDNETIGTVTSGSEQTFSGLDMDVVTGDVIGYYCSNGYIEWDGSGGSVFYYKAGDNIPCTNQTFSAWGTCQISVYGTGTEGGGATEKFGADTGTGTDARASGNPSAAINGSEAGSGADALPFREIALPDSGAGVDALVSLQTPAAKTASDTGAGVDALVSLQVPVAKTVSDNGSGVEAVPIHGAVLADVESGSGVEAFIARLLAAAETGYGAEASEIGGGGLLKHLFAGELGEGADGLTAKIEKPTKGEV